MKNSLSGSSWAWGLASSIWECGFEVSREDENWDSTLTSWSTRIALGQELLIFSNPYTDLQKLYRTYQAGGAHQASVLGFGREM